MDPSSAKIRTIADLRMLAESRGYEVERSTRRDRWRLIGADGAPARAPNGTKAFTMDEALDFLTAPSDAR